MENPKPSRSDPRIRWIESLGKWLLPESEIIRLNDLLDEGMSAREFAWETTVTTSRCIQSATRRGFRLERTVLEAAVLSFPFWSAPLLPAIAAVIPVVVVLRIREGIIFPGDGSPGEMTADALVGASTILISQLVFWSAAPSLVLGTVDVARGTAIGILSVSLLRVFFHLNTPKHNPDRERAARIYATTWRINVMWMLVCLVLVLTNLEALPTSSGLRFWLVFLPIVTFSTALKLQSDAIGGVFNKDVPNPKPVFGAQETELTKMKNRLWKPSDVAWSQCYEAVFFLLLMFPVGIAIWKWSQGAAADIDWRQVWMNLLSTGVLMYLWWLIKMGNAEAAEEINEVIKADKDDANHGS
jgi:hypothetical protein